MNYFKCAGLLFMSCQVQYTIIRLVIIASFFLYLEQNESFNIPGQSLNSFATVRYASFKIHSSTSYELLKPDLMSQRICESNCEVGTGLEPNWQLAYDRDSGSPSTELKELRLSSRCIHNQKLSLLENASTLLSPRA